MSDHYPRRMNSDDLAELMAAAKDGEITVKELANGETGFGLKCSHVIDGACLECLMPMIGGYWGACNDRANLRRRIATLEARLAMVLRYAMNHRKGAFGETREWKQLPVPMRSEDRPLLVRRGRVWSRKRAR